MLFPPLPTQERIRTSFLRSEYERGGVPVFEVTYLEWKKKFYKLTNEDYNDREDFMGVYHHDPATHRRYDLPDRFMILNRSMTNSWRLAVFYHELGHHACTKMRCPCAKDGFVFRKTELHAELASLYIAAHRGFKEMTFNMMLDTVTDLNHKRFDRIYNATRIVKHSAFIYARSIVGKKFTRWLDHKENASLKQRYLNAIVDESTRTCRWTPSAFLRRFVDYGISVKS